MRKIISVIKKIKIKVKVKEIIPKNTTHSEDCLRADNENIKLLPKELKKKKND
jgi:hypothetical protein